MASGVIPGFEVHGFWPALFGSLIISLVSWLLSSLINDRGRVEVIDLKKRSGNRWSSGCTGSDAGHAAVHGHKQKHQDCILFFRMGDFYEMFFEDAITASKILEITLTSRNKGKEDSIPLCGIPYHAAPAYIAKLIDQGFKVAICEQMEDPKQAKGVVKREVVRVVTPGLVLDSDNLDAKENNFLAACIFLTIVSVWLSRYLDGEFRLRNHMTPIFC